MPSGEVANVLVVDDERELRNLLVDALASADLSVSTAGTKQEALDLARRRRPDLLIADVRLPDCSGLEVIDELRDLAGDLPAVVITGYGDARTLTEASRRKPVEMMTKPLNVEHLRDTVRRELKRRDRFQALRKHNRRLRRMVEDMDSQRKSMQGQLETTCAGLTCAYRTLSEQLSLQQMVIAYQNAMIAAKSDDDVFAALFRLFAIRSGGLFGVALVCDQNARLRVIGRFGVPQPDGLSFCEKLAWPAVRLLLDEPKLLVLDAGEELEVFHESIRRHLPGVTLMAIPLVPAPGELIGVAVLYRKGEQPFTDADIALAEMIAFPTATAVRRND
jgi:FixJ family two-component response regulator